MKVALILCASHEENIDIMLKRVYGRIPKIEIILKINKYFFTKFGQLMAVNGKMPYVHGHILFI